MCIQVYLPFYSYPYPYPYPNPKPKPQNQPQPQPLPLPQPHPYSHPNHPNPLTLPTTTSQIRFARTLADYGLTKPALAYCLDARKVGLLVIGGRVKFIIPVKCRIYLHDKS